MPNPTEKAREVLDKVLAESFPNARRHVGSGAGGFVVALESPLFDDAFGSRQAAQDIADRVWETSRHLEPEDRIVLFDLRFFPSESALFSEDAMLRTQHRRWEGGIMVATTTIGDAPVSVHWVDAETLLIAPLILQTCRVMPKKGLPYQPLELPRPFAHLELGGSVFPVLKVEKDSNGRWWDVQIDNPGPR